MNNNKLMEAFGHVLGGMVQGQGVVKLNGTIKLDFDVKGTMCKTEFNSDTDKSSNKEEIDVKGSLGVKLEDFVADATISGGTNVGCKCEGDDEFSYEDVEEFIKTCIEKNNVKILKTLNKKDKNQ